MALLHSCTVFYVIHIYNTHTGQDDEFVTELLCYITTNIIKSCYVQSFNKLSYLLTKLASLLHFVTQQRRLN